MDAIVCGFICAYHPAALGSNPKHTIYAFPICIIEIVMKKDENKQKRGQDWPIFLKKLQFWIPGFCTKFQSKFYFYWTNKILKFLPLCAALVHQFWVDQAKKDKNNKLNVIKKNFVRKKPHVLPMPNIIDLLAYYSSWSSLELIDEGLFRPKW